MADEEFKIHITADADTSGFKTTAQATKDLGTANADTKEKTDELSGAQEKNAEHANILHKNHRLVHNILHLIAHESGPAAGAALAAMGALGGGGIMVAFVAAKELLEVISGLADKAKEFKEAMEAQVDLSPLITELGTVASEIDTAKAKTAEFFAEVNRKAAEVDGFKKMADAEIEQMKRVFEEKKKIADAEAEMEKKVLEYRKVTDPNFTEEQYRQGLAAIEATKQNKKDSADSDLAAKTIQFLQMTLGNIEIDKGNTGPTLEPANEKAEESKSRFENLKKQLDKMRTLLEEHSKMLMGEGKEGKGGLLTMWNEMEDGAKETAEDFVKAGKLDPSTDDIHALAMNHGGAFNAISPDEVRQAIKLAVKIAEERQAQAGIAATIRGDVEKIPKAEADSKEAAAAVKVIEEKIKKLEADEKSIQEELAKRQGEDDAKADAAPDLAAAQTIAGAYAANTPKPLPAGHHLTPEASLKQQLEENQKVALALAAAITDFVSAHKETGAIHSKFVDALNNQIADIRAKNIQLQQQIDAMPHTTK